MPWARCWWSCFIVGFAPLHSDAQVVFAIMAGKTFYVALLHSYPNNILIRSVQDYRTLHRHTATLVCRSWYICSTY